MEYTIQGEDPGSIHTQARFNNALVAGWEYWVTRLIKQYCCLGCDQQNCSTELSKGAHYLHSEFNIRRDYLGLFKQATQFVPDNHRHWGWYPMVDTPILRIGLLSIHRHHSIPLHDHPNSYGMQKVISGRVRIKQFHCDTEPGLHLNLVSLEQIADQVLQKGESTSFLPTFGNLHALESISPVSIMLTMMANPYQPHERSWYFQVPFTQNGNKGLFNRIRKRTAA